MSGTRKQLRAVFLAVVMVTSVLAAGVAFSGSAAGSSLISDEVQFEDDQGDLVLTKGVVPGMTVQVGPVPVDSADGNDAVFAFDVDGSETIEQDEVIEVVQDGSAADLSGGSADGQASVFS